MPTLFRIYVVCLCDGSVVRSILKSLSLPNRYHAIVKPFILALTQSALPSSPPQTTCVMSFQIQQQWDMKFNFIIQG